MTRPRRLGPRAALPALALLAAGALAAGCAADDGGSAGPTTTAPSATASTPDTEPSGVASGSELWLRFDGSGDDLDLDNSGSALVDVEVSAAGANITVAPGRDSGQAARLPEPAGAGAAAIVVAPQSPDPLSPVERDFSFGAEFLLDDPAGDGGSGSNLVQRGLYEGPQYKLQLDGGVPSCRVAGPQGEVFVEATDPVEPGEWHSVVCSRSGDEVTLEITRDGDSEATEWSETGRTGGLVFPPRIPVSVGGKVDGDGEVMADDADQLHGLVDEVFVRIG